MKLQLFALALMAAITATSSLSFMDVIVEEWNTFKAEHGKVYPGGPAEEKIRMKIYMQNKAMIARHNRLAHTGHHSYFLKMNQFGDLLHSEQWLSWSATMNRFRTNIMINTTHDSGTTFVAPEGFEAPTKIDWRKKGAVTKVKTQGSCTSGDWAFSATGSLEGQHFRKTGKLVSLSEQNLLDCTHGKKYQNYGCFGGRPFEAFKFIRNNHGLDTESSYPYRSCNLNISAPCHHDQSCKFKRSSVGAIVKGFVNLPKGDEKSLAVAVAAHGPISVAIDATNLSILFYDHGIYDEPKCSPKDLSKFMLVVGYGPGYWLVKSSWSTLWGMDGYIKMKRGGNQCGIAEMASYPLV